MEDNLITLLESFKLPVIRQGSLAPTDPYPDTFFTFWNNEESEHSSYDNDAVLLDNSFDVNVYSTSPAKVYQLIREAASLLKQNGWVILVRGYDAMSDEVTHTGRGMQVGFLQNVWR